MVKLALSLQATLSGVTSLTFETDPSRPEEYYYSFQVQCSTCREIHPNHIQVSRHEESEHSGSRGTSHFLWRCKNCGREASANIDPVIATYDVEDSGTRKKMVSFETRGCEFVGFRADGVFRCVGSEGKRRTAFEGVELGDGEWYDYDDSAAGEVSITEVQWTIARA